MRAGPLARRIPEANALPCLAASMHHSGMDDEVPAAVLAEFIGETVIERHGFEPSAVRARIKVRMAVVDLADGRPTIARASDDQAAWALRKLSRERPPERPTPRDPLADLAGRNGRRAS